MSEAIKALQAAMQRAIEIRPKVGGFPYLAETLRRCWRIAKPLVPAGLSECLPDRTRFCRTARHAVGFRDGRSS